MEKRNLEQPCAIKFCVKLNENATETYEKLRRACGEHALLRTQVFGWHKAFLDGRESVEDEPRCGRPCTSKTDENVTKVRDIVRSDRRLTVRMIISVLNLNRQTVHDSEKAFIVSGQRLLRLDAASRQCSLSHCHLRERIFGQKRYLSGPQPPYSPDLSPCDFFLFLKLKFHLKGRHFGTGQHPKGRGRPSVGTSTWRLPALLPGVGATAPAVCGFPSELHWRW